MSCCAAVLSVEEDQRGGDGADVPGTQADPAQCFEGGLSSEFPRSATARVAECRALTARWFTVSPPPAGVLNGQASRELSPW